MSYYNIYCKKVDFNGELVGTDLECFIGSDKHDKHYTLILGNTLREEIEGLLLADTKNTLSNLVDKLDTKLEAYDKAKKLLKWATDYPNFVWGAY